MRRNFPRWPRVTRLALLLGLILLLLAGFDGPAAQAAEDVAGGFQDMNYQASGVSEPTGEKPQSKLWYHDGRWWGSFYSVAAGEHRIFALDWLTQQWSDIGVALDDRESAKADVLWDGSHLYVASGNSSGPARLYRYSYANDTYALDPGYPVEITGDGVIAIVLTKDGLGNVWATYTSGSKVYVAHTSGNDNVWVAPYVLPVGGATGLIGVDISTIVGYAGRIGILWSNQNDGQTYFAAHVDGQGDAAGDWQMVAAYTLSADDHVNIKDLQADPSGAIYAVVKTSFALDNEPGIVLLACTNGDCSAAANWSAYTVYNRDTPAKRTRPILLLDSENREIYVFMAVTGGGTLYYKKTSMDSIGFEAGGGTSFIDLSSVNNPTSTKQTLNSVSGLVVAASDNTYYYHNCFTLIPSSTDCPDPNAPSTFEFGQAEFSVAEGGGMATVEIIRSNPASGAAAVTVVTGGGTALPGEDYTASPITVTFAQGQASKTASVPINDDALDEPDETVGLSLSNPTNGAKLGPRDTAVLTLVDDDEPPAISFGQADYFAGEDAGTAIVDVRLDAVSAFDVQVSYATGGGSAQAGVDYQVVPQTQMTIPAGQLSQSFQVTIQADAVDEGDETVDLGLTAPGNATLGATTTAELTIVDDDLQARFESATLNAPEASASVTLSLTLQAAPAYTRTVTYAVDAAASTATAGLDFGGSLTGTVAFLPGQQQATVSIPLLDDELDEEEELLVVDLVGAEMAVVGSPSRATVTIDDDDEPPQARFDVDSLVLTELDATSTIHIELSAPSAKLVSVDYASSAGTATPGSDYSLPGGKVIFAPGQQSQSLSLTVFPDLLREGEEFFHVLLKSAENASLGDPGVVTVTIQDGGAIFLPLLLRAP